ncbi:hypothetical protein AB0K48_61325, partial [Nonomuraea sp. NPDC055795]
MRTDIEPKAGPKEWIGLAVLALPTLLLSLDVTVLHLAVPHLGADLNPSSTQTLWIIDIYGFMIAGFEIEKKKYDADVNVTKFPMYYN